MLNPMFIKNNYQFDIGYRENEKYWLIESHYHNEYEIVYVAGGMPEFTINGKSYRVKKDSLIFINNVESHEYTILQYPYCRYVIMVKPDFINSFINEPILTSALNLRPQNFIHVLELTDEQIPIVLEILNKMLQEYKLKKPYWENTVRLYIHLLLAWVFRFSEEIFPLSNLDMTSNKRIILDVQKYLEDNYAQDVSLDDISNEFHISKHYLCHLFKEVTGNTFKTYLTLQRISNAKDLLAYTDNTVTSVGTACGFSNVNHFIRTFKKVVGITPLQYRKKNVSI